MKCLILAALAVCASLWAAPAVAAVLTASSLAELQTDIRIAKPGDVAFLGCGTYQGAAIKRALGGVTFKSANPLCRAQLPDLVVQGYTANGVTVIAGGATFDGVDLVRARIEHAAGVRFVNVHVYTPGLSDPLQATGNGITFSYSNTVSVTSSDVSYVLRGVVFNATTDFTVSSTLFHDVRSDGIDIGSPSSLGVLDHNTFRDFKPLYTGNPATEDHCDAVQFTIQNAKVGTHDVTVSNNLVDFTRSIWCEGMLVGDTPPAGVHYDRLTFRGNTILGSDNPIGPGGGLQLFYATNTTLDSNTVDASKGGRPYAIVGDKTLTYVNNRAQLWANGASGITIPAFSDGGAALMAASPVSSNWPN